MWCRNVIINNIIIGQHTVNKHMMIVQHVLLMMLMMTENDVILNCIRAHAAVRITADDNSMSDQRTAATTAACSDVASIGACL